MIKAGILTKSFTNLPSSFNNKMSFFIFNQTKSKLFDLDIKELSSDEKFHIPHPCDPREIGFNAEACWRASILLNKEGGLNRLILNKGSGNIKPLRISKKGIWIGKSKYTDDVIKARRLIFEQAYIYQIGQILNRHYAITKNYNIYEIFDRMNKSNNEFVFYDCTTVRAKENGRGLNYLNHWPIAHLWVRYIRTISESLEFVNEFYNSAE